MTQLATHIPAPESGLSDRDFRRIAAIAHDAAGLMIPESKAAMVRSRLAKRMRKLALDDIGAYLDRVEGGDGPELREMISVLTTNVTSFYRESHHFDLMTKDIVSGLREKAERGERVRLWSAGCSTGAEPYTMAMTLLEHSPTFQRSDTRILATDIDRAILAVGKSGVYTPERVQGLPPAERARYFKPLDNGTYEALPSIRRLITFRELNLISSWPMTGLFDIIFCRNVTIYFDEATQTDIWTRFFHCLAPGGWLFVGHSERVPDAVGFQSAGNTVYRKPQAGFTAQSVKGASHVR